MDSRNYTLVIAAKTLFRDEEGFVITIELILIATIVGIGSIVGLTTLRNAINSELADVSAAIESLELGGNGNNGNGNNGNGATTETVTTPTAASAFRPRQQMRLKGRRLFCSGGFRPPSTTVAGSHRYDTHRLVKKLSVIRRFDGLSNKLQFGQWPNQRFTLYSTTCVHANIFYTALPL